MTPTHPTAEEIAMRIVSAAVIHRGVVHTAPHHHLAMWQIACCWGEKANGEQGFVASDGQFYDRIEAKKIARLAGQIKFPLAHEPEELFSEELWSYADWCNERGMSVDGVKMDDSPARRIAAGMVRDSGAIPALERCLEIAEDACTSEERPDMEEYAAALDKLKALTGEGENKP